jgi:hypothetical protein
MPDPHATRLSAAPIGRIRCFETGLEIGLLYRWDDGVMQVALHNEGPTATEVADSLVKNSNC